MKTTRFIAYTICLQLIALSLPAQPGKMDKALDGFLKTEFMQQFLDLRAEAENAVRSFQPVAGEFQPQQTHKIMSGYEQTANRANGILRGIITDFMDSKKMKYIADFPDHYAKGLKADLQELSGVYSGKFQQPLNDLVNPEVDGMPWILAVTQLISLTSQLVDHFGKVRLEKRHMTKEYLDANLYQPFRFRSWEELAGGSLASDPYNIKPDERKVFNPLDSLPAIDTSGYEKWEEPGAGAPDSVRQVAPPKSKTRRKGSGFR